VLEFRRAIPFLAIPLLAFALAILVSGCGTGSTPTPTPTAAPTSSPSPRPTPTPVAEVTKTPGPTDKLDRIGRNRAKWAQAGIDTYRITLHYGCFCDFGDGRPVSVRVVDGEIAEAVVDGKPLRKRESRGYPMTVEALFDFAETAKADADKVELVFDRQLGYPTSISVDHDLNGDDDEFQVTVTELVPES
jgi:hypothetical protein